MPVAKIYENLNQIGEPYMLHGHTYVKVDLNGVPKEVRMYSDAEYHEMYDNPYQSPQLALGFEKGYITIFKGNTRNLTYWFTSKNARYSKIFGGWYFPSSEILPSVLPEGIEPIRINWTDISNNGKLKPETEINDIINSHLFDPSTSTYKGVIGQKQTFILTVIKAIPVDTRFGSSTIHTMVDKDNNEFVWTTGSKTLVVGNKYKVTGTIKEHKKYRNVKQTILTRCVVENLEG